MDVDVSRVPAYTHGYHPRLAVTQVPSLMLSEQLNLPQAFVPPISLYSTAYLLQPHVLSTIMNLVTSILSLYCSRPCAPTKSSN